MICEPPTNHDILREPSSIIVLFTYKASFYVFPRFFSSSEQDSSSSQSSAKRASIVCLQKLKHMQLTVIEGNAHAKSITCSRATFATNCNVEQRLQIVRAAPGNESQLRTTQFKDKDVFISFTTEIKVQFCITSRLLIVLKLNKF